MRHGFLSCPGNCGDLIRAKIAEGSGWMGTTVPAPNPHYRVVDYRSHCPCGWDDRFLPLLPTQDELQAAYAAGEDE